MTATWAVAAVMTSAATAGRRRAAGMSDGVANVLVAGQWRPAQGAGTFEVRSPATGEVLGSYPVSSWGDADEALGAGVAAFDVIAGLGAAPIVAFLEGLAARLGGIADELVERAHDETALPVTPRLRDVELPRATDQLRQAAAAARSGAWRHPVLSPASGIAAMNTALPGPVVVFGPNNFPFAFNGVAGGDFAAAVATGHPVVAKSNPGHPGTTALLADAALGAAVDAGLPPATVQLIHHLEPDDGCRLVADPRIAATAYTGSRRAGTVLKAAADAAGRPIYLELSSINPVVVLPGASADVAGELASSVLLGGGQFCTSPGLILAIGQDGGDELLAGLASRLGDATGATLLGAGVAEGFDRSVSGWLDAGAKVVAVGHLGEGSSVGPTVATTDGSTFLTAGAALQEEAFGSAALVVLAADADELVACVRALEGQLTGAIYSGDGDGDDDQLYVRVEPPLRQRVGRLLNDKVPTGVAVVPAMHHGGPWPATGAPQFTAVGLPASLVRFTQRQSWDNVRDDRLPPELQAANPLGIERSVADRP
jgi:NADP-dependent aldehyde dehydrogenase